MILTLKRKWLNTETPTTIGELYVDGKFQCFSCEDIVRPAGQKIKHQTAIPAGKYEVTIGWSNRFQKPLPRLSNVPMFDGILIHSGNTAADTSGCILVGKAHDSVRVTQSRLAFAELFNLLTKATLSEKIWIEIHNPPQFRNTALPAHPKVEKGIQVATSPQKRKEGPFPPQEMAYSVSVPSDFSPRMPAFAPLQAPLSRAADSLRTGNTLPVLVSAVVAARDFLQQNYRWAILLLILCAACGLAWYEFGPKARRK